MEALARQKQPWKHKALPLKENSSFTTTHSRPRKASVGVTVGFSSRTRKLKFSPQGEGEVDNACALPHPSLFPFNDNVKNVSEVPRSNPEELLPLNVEAQAGCGRKTWTPHNPFPDRKVSPLKPQIMPLATNEQQQQHIIYPEAVQSTKIVEEIYANRKSVLHSEGNECVVEEAGFATTRQTNFVKYERRKNMNKQVVGELCIERSQHVKFNFERSQSSPSPSPSPSPSLTARQKRNKSKDNSSETALRMKLRNALGLLNSSPSAKQEEVEAPPAQNEPQSDSIETDSQEARQIAKPLQRGRGRGRPNVNPKSLLQRDKRKISPPPGIPHIFSFDQDEDEALNFSSKFKRKFQPSLPDANTGLKVLLQTTPEKIICQSPANTVVEEQIQKHHSPTPAGTDTGVGTAIAAMTTSAESPPASPLVRINEMLKAEEKATVQTEKEELPLFIDKDAGIRRSTRRVYRNRVIEAKTCEQRQVKRKSTEFTSFAYSSKQSSSKKSEDGSDDSSDLLRAVKQFTGILQKFKLKLKMEVDRKATQILSSASHNIHTEVDRIQSQIQSDVAKYANLCKAKQRQWEANLQDQNEKLRQIHEKFKEDLAQHSQTCQIVFSQIEGEEIEMKSIGERQKVSHKKLVSQMQEIIESELANADGKITGLRKAAANNMQALKRVMGQSY